MLSSVRDEIDQYIAQVVAKNAHTPQNLSGIRYMLQQLYTIKPDASGPSLWIKK